MNYAHRHTLSVLMHPRYLLGLQVVEERFPLDVLIYRYFGDVDGVPRIVTIMEYLRC